MAICPECRDDKHRNCGPALDESTDEIIPCGCETCAELAADDDARARERHESWWA